jgi:hypothetical protein
MPIRNIVRLSTGRRDKQLEVVGKQTASLIYQPDTACLDRHFKLEFDSTAWVITITESLPLRPVDYQMFLCYLVRWANTISEDGIKSSGAIPETACIYRMDILQSGMWKEKYASHSQIFFVSFSLSARSVQVDRVDLDVKEEAHIIERNPWLGSWSPFARA